MNNKKKVDILQLVYDLDKETNLYIVKSQINRFHYQDNLTYDEIYARIWYWFVGLKKEFKSKYGIAYIQYVTVPNVLRDAIMSGDASIEEIIEQFIKEDAADDADIEKIIKN